MKDSKDISRNTLKPRHTSIIHLAIGISILTHNSGCSMDVHVKSPEQEMPDLGSAEPAARDEKRAAAEQTQSKEVTAPSTQLPSTIVDPTPTSKAQEQCHLDFSTQEIRNLFLDMSGCPKSPSLTASIIAENTLWLQSQGSQIHSEQIASKVSGLTQANIIVKKCAVLNAARSIQAKASAACTTRSSKETGDFLAPVIDLLNKSIVPAVKLKTARVTDVKNWDDELIASTLAMFGSLDRFKSVVERFNSNIQNKNAAELDNDDYDSAAALFETILQHKVFDEKGQINVIHQLNISPHNRATDEFKRDYNEFHNLARAMHLTDSPNVHILMKDTHEFLLKRFGIDVSIEAVEGKWVIYPKLSISVRAELPKIEEAINSLKKQ